MFGMEWRELRAQYVEVLQTLNKIPKELALYYADKASTEEMKLQIDWYNRNVKGETTK